MAARNTGKNAEGSNVDIDIGEDIGKAWNLGDPYRFAPKRPDGDPWKVLLDPLLEKERIECDGWKDEVGNLLIFAGLFSAVLTGFIIDSYKTLQPSDSKDIIALLSQIASNQLNNTINPSGTTTTSNIITILTPIQLPSQTFKPPPSAVRINALWFLSLILSLAVVLIGIVCLQWLRQHQAFPGQSPRSALALYNMRVEGMRRWHVSKILMSLPVLLQAALVLFFVGVLDFLRSLGEGRTVLVCVAVVVGATMLFLLGTTTAPALQMIFLPFRIMIIRSAVGRESEEKRRPPSQCPYKSPQSSVVCGLVDFLLRGCAGVVGWLRPQNEGGDDGEKGTGKGKKRRKVRVSRHLSALWSTRSWIEFDLIWLKIRDACAQSVYTGRFGRLDEEVLQEEGMGIVLPLYDTLSLFRDFTSKGKTRTLSSEVVIAAYHCLAEVSGAVTLGRLTPPGRDVRGELEVVKEWNSYLRYSCDERFETLEFTSGPASSLHVVVGASSSAIATAPIGLALASDIIRLLHDQNLCMFLDHITGDGTGNTTTTGKGKEVFFHRQELRTRIQLYMLAGKWSLASRFGVYPTYLEFGHGHEYDRGVWRDFPDEEVMFTYQYIHLINKFFGYFSSSSIHANNDIAPTDLHARAEVLVLLEECARAISRVAAHLAARQALGYGAVGLGGRVKGMLDGVRGCLERGVDGLGFGGGGGISGTGGGVLGGRGRGRPEDVLHLFYCAGMVVCGCVGLPESVGPPAPFESAYMGLKGFLKAFKKGAGLGLGGEGMGMGMSRAEEEEFGGSVREVERRFREGYPNDGEVERGLGCA